MTWVGWLLVSLHLRWIQIQGRVAVTKPADWNRRFHSSKLGCQVLNCLLQKQKRASNVVGRQKPDKLVTPKNEQERPGVCRTASMEIADGDSGLIIPRD